SEYTIAPVSTLPRAPAPPMGSVQGARWPAPHRSTGTRRRDVPDPADRATRTIHRSRCGPTRWTRGRAKPSRGEGWGHGPRLFDRARPRGRRGHWRTTPVDSHTAGTGP